MKGIKKNGPSESGGDRMKHTLQINVSKKKPMNGSAISVRRVFIRERLMRFLFSDTVWLTVIVPENSVEEL